MSWEVAKRCNERKFGSASRKQVIMFLADKASDDGEGIYCSKHSIAKFTELSLATVKRIIRDFTSEGILVQTGERDCDFGYTNEYRICLEAVSKLDDLTKRKSDAQGGRQQTGVSKTPDAYDPASEVTTTPPPGSSRPPNHPKTIQTTYAHEHARGGRSGFRESMGCLSSGSTSEQDHLSAAIRAGHRGRHDCRRAYQRDPSLCDRDRGLHAFEGLLFGQLVPRGALAALCRGGARSADRRCRT